MKRDLKLLAEEVEKKIGLDIHLQKDWEKMVEIFRKHHIVLKKLSPQALDRLALFAGFQDWKSFQDALRGEGRNTL